MSVTSPQPTATPSPPPAGRGQAASIAAELHNPVGRETKQAPAGAAK